MLMRRNVEGLSVQRARAEVWEKGDYECGGAHDIWKACSSDRLFNENPIGCVQAVTVRVFTLNHFPDLPNPIEFGGRLAGFEGRGRNRCWARRMARRRYSVASGRERLAGTPLLISCGQPPSCKIGESALLSMPSMSSTEGNMPSDLLHTIVETFFYFFSSFFFPPNTVPFATRLRHPLLVQPSLTINVLVMMPCSRLIQLGDCSRDLVCNCKKKKNLRLNLHCSGHPLQIKINDFPLRRCGFSRRALQMVHGQYPQKCKSHPHRSRGPGRKGPTSRCIMCLTNGKKTINLPDCPKNFGGDELSFYVCDMSVNLASYTVHWLL
ncbi:hypothetical protein VP01_931g1 [Puccinia sorghi]|uniref:Uncharacterized protein n=1 Tax=Puccinia sorghi TaxID=27349 RepID=A0A0L6U6Y7_9BASI|nr:hypothetical protein VP01_931g1 [Puccinia sorghi]